MSIDVAAVDWARLSDRSREILNTIAIPLSEGQTHEQIAAELDVPVRIVRKALDELAAEARAQVHGAELPPLTQSEYELLRDDITEHGQLVPILVDANGEVIDGRNRLRACQELGLEPVVRQIDVNDPEEARILNLVANLARRHLDNGDRRRLVEAEIIHRPERSDRQIARLTGFSHVGVAKVRRQLEERGRVVTVTTRIGADGVAQTVRARATEPEEPPARVEVDRAYFEALEALLAVAADIDGGSALAVAVARCRALTPGTETSEESA